MNGWEFETLTDIIEMCHKGPEPLIEAADGVKKRLNGRPFMKHPRERQRDSK